MRFSEAEAAQYLGVHYRTVRYWRVTNKPRVKFRLIGNRAYYEKEDLDRYLEGVVVKPEEAK